MGATVRPPLRSAATPGPHPPPSPSCRARPGLPARPGHRAWQRLRYALVLGGRWPWPSYPGRLPRQGRPWARAGGGRTPSRGSPSSSTERGRAVARGRWRGCALRGDPRSRIAARIRPHRSCLRRCRRRRRRTPVGAWSRRRRVRGHRARDPDGRGRGVLPSLPGGARLEHAGEPFAHRRSGSCQAPVRTSRSDDARRGSGSKSRVIRQLTQPTAPRHDCQRAGGGPNHDHRSAGHCRAQLTDRALQARISGPEARCVASVSDPDEWFPVTSEPARARAQSAHALALCAVCAVRAECLELALRRWADAGRAWHLGRNA